jgi:hypothetical protein
MEYRVKSQVIAALAIATRKILFHGEIATDCSRTAAKLA